MLLANRGFIAGPSRAWTVLGGTITTFTLSGITYRCHTFTGSGSLVVVGPNGLLTAEELLSLELTVEYFLVGGGGGGGGANGGALGGGGGAGGIRHGLIGLVPNSTWTAGIGAGGPGGAATTNGTAGGDTTMFGLTASGGGYGGSGLATSGGGNPGGPGGNGGGGGAGLGGAAQAGGAATPATTPAQGVAGQSADTSTGYGGYGGSLALIAGYPPRGAAALFGTPTDITGAISQFAAGGTWGVQVAGATNTGNGGAGGPASSAGLSGGSGIAMARYRIA